MATPQLPVELIQGLVDSQPGQLFGSSLATPTTPTDKTLSKSLPSLDTSSTGLTFEDLAKQFGGRLGTSSTVSGPSQTFATGEGENLFVTTIRRGETPEQFQQRLLSEPGLSSRFSQASTQPAPVIDPSTGLPVDPAIAEGEKRDRRRLLNPTKTTLAPDVTTALPSTDLPLPPPGGAPNPGVQFAPDFQFAVDPDDPNSQAAFINSLLTALGPALASGQFSNFQRSPNDLGNAFAGFESGSPFENMLNQLLSSQLTGGAGDSPVDFASGGEGSVQDLISQLFGQPSGQSLSTGRASELFQQLLSSGGTGSNLQAFTEQQLRDSISGGGISPEFVGAARERILAPANEALLGRLNQQGGGVADLSSPLFQELQRRQESDFANDLILFGGQNQSNLLGQAASLGQNQFQNIFGVGQAQGQLGQNQQQINQGAIGLAGMLQNLFAQQGFQASGQGLTREQLALQNQQQENEFGLGQSAIGSDILQTLLAGREGGGGFGAFLSALLGTEGNLGALINLVINNTVGGNDDGTNINIPNPCDLPGGSNLPGCGGDENPPNGEETNPCDNPQTSAELEACAPAPDDPRFGDYCRDFPDAFACGGGGLGGDGGGFPNPDDDCSNPLSRRFLEGDCGGIF